MAIANQVVEKYPVGKKVDVYYDPSDHKISVLEPGYGGGILFLPFMGTGILIVLAFVIFAIWYLSIREDKNKEPVKSPYNF